MLIFLLVEVSMLPYSLMLARMEQRERWRDFNARAARGDFVRQEQPQPKSAARSRVANCLAYLRRLVRLAASATAALA